MGVPEVERLLLEKCREQGVRCERKDLGGSLAVYDLCGY